MPVHSRKDTTPTPPDSTEEQTAPALPEQTFRKYVRSLARAGPRIVLEEVMPSLELVGEKVASLAKDIATVPTPATW